MLYNVIQAHDYDLAQAGWQADFDDAATFLELFQTGGGNNWAGWSNKEFDGLIDKAIISTSDLEALADLPAREVLQAQLLGLLLSPATKLVRLLNEPAASLARLLNAKAQQEQKPAEATT